MISDLTTWLMIIAPVVTVLLVIYYLIRKLASDEMESKKWNSRIVVSLESEEKQMMNLSLSIETS